jgi:hypothetical protein
LLQKPRINDQARRQANLLIPLNLISDQALSGSAGERPRSLDWIGARTAEQWLKVLRIKTPLGGVYLNTAKFSPQIEVTVTDSTGHITKESATQPEYFYPHEIPDQKISTVKDIEKALSSIQGSSEEKFTKLDPSLKRLDILWETYSTDELSAADTPFSSALSEEERGLVERHKVVVYASFLRSAKMWGDLNDNVLKLKPGERLIHGGLQMASDFMPQGDLAIIPLTSTIGYQANSHIIVHFADGSPDMGRKVFQPELTKLAEKIAVRCVTIFKRYLQHLKPDTGATTLAPDKELYDWRAAQVIYRDKNPLSFISGGNELTILSMPQQEQDVIALFHQLIGLGTIRGLNFFATSQNERYDSLYSLNYKNDSFKFSKKLNPLGVNPSFAFPYLSEPRILEYKFDLDALIRDFSTEVKFATHINLVVCWKATKQFREKYFLSSLLVGDEGSSRTVYGATHQAYPEGGGAQPHFEVLILDDLLRYLQDPEVEEARQKSVYKD